MSANAKANNADAASVWIEANQRYLMARLAVVREALDRYIAHPDDVSSAIPPSFDITNELRQASEALPAPAALDTLCSAFILSSFERDLLLLCAGAELDFSFAQLLTAAGDHTSRSGPTFSLALATLQDPHWSAITPAGPLRHWRLLEVGAGEALVLSPLKIDERVFALFSWRFLPRRAATEPGCIPSSAAGAATFTPFLGGTHCQTLAAA